MTYVLRRPWWSSKAILLALGLTAEQTHQTFRLPCLRKFSEPFALGFEASGETLVASGSDNIEDLQRCWVETMGHFHHLLTSLFEDLILNEVDSHDVVGGLGDQAGLLTVDLHLSSAEILGHIDGDHLEVLHCGGASIFQTRSQRIYNQINESQLFRTIGLDGLAGERQI